MARKQEDTVEDALCHLFPSDWLAEQARETGMVQRQRKVNPISLLVFFSVESDLWESVHGK